MDNSLHWYAVLTKTCQEKMAAKKLEALGIEYYLPIQRKTRQWSDRKKMVESVVIPRMIFVHTTEKDRVIPLQNVAVLTRYMMSLDDKRPLIIPDVQLERFRRLVEANIGEVYFTTQQFAKGDKVRILEKGYFCGWEGVLKTIEGENHLFIEIGQLGSASIKVKFKVTGVEKIKE